MLKYLQNKKNREDYLRNMLGAFAEENKDLVIIVADPVTDYMFVAHKSKMVLGKLKSLDGKSMNVVHGVIRHSVLKSKFSERMDLFLAGMIDLLKLSVYHGNQFYDFIRNVLFRFQPNSGRWITEQKKVDQMVQNTDIQARNLDDVVEENVTKGTASLINNM